MREGVSVLPLLALSACADDSLIAEPEAPPAQQQCGDGAPAADPGACPTPAAGSISGRLCDRSVGIWLEGITASVTTSAGTLSDVTDLEGRFDLTGVPPGGYYVALQGPSYSNVLAAQVEPGAVTTIGAADCVPPPGHLRGRVCHESAGVWLRDATVVLSDTAGTSTRTDDFGHFMFYSVPAGDYTLGISHAGGYTATRHGTVRSGEITDLGPSSCSAGAGSISGRICGGDGYWLSGAAVWVDLTGGARVDTTTDAQGFYTLSGLPDGTHTVHVNRGSFSTSFPATVANGQPTVLPTPVCIPPTARMLVITGVYDSVEDVLTALGYGIRNRYVTRTPTVVGAGGTVDVIEADTGSFWLTDFMTDPAWMAGYDILFFNCGLYDQDLLAGGATVDAAIANLRSFIQGGGSMYASDWASEIVRLAFPGRVNFLGSDTSAGAARLGLPDDSLGATVTDAGLRVALGRGDVSINLNLPEWVVVDRRGSQPPDLRILLQANVTYLNLIFPTTLDDSPIVMRFDYGAGRVLFTSAHNEGQNTRDLEDVLNYIVFEL